MTSDIDTRIERSIREEGEIRQLNDGHGHEQPTFLAWRKRSEAAIAENSEPTPNSQRNFEA